MLLLLLPYVLLPAAVLATTARVHRSETPESTAAGAITTMAAPSTSRSGLVPATSPLIRWQGRTVRDEAASSVSWDWLGTTFSATVAYPAPTYLSATFDLSRLPNATHARLSVSVSSGGPNRGYVIPHTQVSLHPRQSGVPVLLAAGLWSAGATVHVTSNVPPDYMGGPIRLLSLESDGTFVPTTPPLVNRTILIIGDSITAASNLNRQHGDPAFGIPAQGTCADGGLYSDYSLSYMAQLCRAFDARCTTVAVGGKGMLMNCCDTGPTMPDYFGMTQKSDDKPTYSFPPGDAPDAVVINLGTNDWSGCQKFSEDKCGPKFQSAFAEQYTSFMRNITRWWPQTPIKFFAGVGPIIDGYGAAVEKAVAQAVTGGINATMVDMRACPAYQPPKPGLFECDGCATRGQKNRRPCTSIV